MNNETAPNRDIRDIWQSQPTEGATMPLEEIRRRAGKFQSRIAWRNAREYAAALVVVLFFAYRLLRTNDILGGTGMAMIIAGVLYVVWHLHRHGSARSLPEELGRSSCLGFHRDELARQRDLLRGVWRWYLGPLIPGLVVVMAATARGNPGHLPHIAWWTAGYGVVVAALFVFIGRLNASGARRLQRMIDELDAQRGEQ